MPITPPPTEAPINYTVLDLITDALIEIGMLSPGEMPDGETAQWAFRKLNYMLDSWAARKNYVYASTFNSYTLVPGLSPHLIGPDSATAQFVVPQRPVKIVRATIILTNTTPPVSINLEMRDEQWWMENTIKDLQSSQPTDLFYNPAYPNGELYFWPVPQTAYGTQLECWGLLAQFANIQDELGGPGSGVFSVTPGYRNAMMLTLAETLLPGGEKEANPALVAHAMSARNAVFGNNTKTVRMSTRDAGIPGADNELRSTTFSYKSRSW